MRVERGLASRFTFAMSWPNWRYTVLRVIVTGPKREAQTR